jgi:hypothetical protein
MATIDTSMYGQIARPSRIQTPYEQQNQLSAVLQGVNQNRAAEMQIRKAKADEAKQNRLAALLSSEYGAPEERESALMRGGFAAEAQDMTKNRLAAGQTQATTQKTLADTEKQKLATAIEKIGAVGQLLGGVRDQGTYDQARAQAQAMGLDVSAMPPQYDPAMVEQKRAQSLNMEQQLAQVWKQKGFDLDVQKFGETKRSNLAGEGLQRRGQDITARGQNLTDARGRDANALKAREIEMMGQPSVGGAVLGAPIPKVLPWANQSNPKDANKVKAVEQSRGAKEIEKDIDAVRKEKDAAAMAARFIELNKTTKTGGLTDRMGITRGLQSLGPEYAEMEAITAKLAPAMRVEGSGSTSDFDGKQFERATVGVDKPAKSNENIAKGLMARAQQAEEYADFRQTYLEQNGTLQGADRFWKEYANKNPIFDPSKPGTFELNRGRKPWVEHFKTQSPAGTKPAGGVVDFNDLGG